MNPNFLVQALREQGGELVDLLDKMDDEPYGLRLLIDQLWLHIEIHTISNDPNQTDAS
jgi:hypothetical protein